MSGEAEYVAIQNELRKGISLCDDFEMTALKTAAGVDLAYWKSSDGEYAVCCIVVIDIVTHKVIEKKHFSGRIEVPYIPGFLAFRELPLVLKTVELLDSKPDLFVFDGNGYLHPRHMGIATHASFYLDKPTFGVAKSYFRVDKQTDYVEPENEAGSFTDIVIDGEVYGRALRTHKDVRPVFVSVGNHISLETACRLALKLTDKESHVPVPTRLADLETHVERENARRKGKNKMKRYDVRAQITVTGKEECLSGYRPAHLINNTLTTGVHTYVGTERLKKNQSAEGYVTFISPENYKHTIRVGDRIPFQDGSRMVGYIEVLEILNELLDADNDSTV